MKVKLCLPLLLIIFTLTNCETSSACTSNPGESLEECKESIVTDGYCCYAKYSFNGQEINGCIEASTSQYDSLDTYKRDLSKDGYSFASIECDGKSTSSAGGFSRQKYLAVAFLGLLFCLL